MDTIFYLIGLLVLFLNKIRYGIFGYGKPRDFSRSEIAKAAEYDDQVVDNWVRHLREYAGSGSLKGKKVLELGPGADLGTGLIILSRGAASYQALDANELAKMPVGFYQELLKHLGKKENGLIEQMIRYQEGRPDKLDYVVDKDFDPSIFSGVDLIFSQAAFEHFDNVAETAERLSKAAKKGAVLIAEIDLRTHTGFLVKRDPLNIYRYPNFLYDLFKFPGIPNRLRPKGYIKAFEDGGWQDVRVRPLKTMPRKELQRTSGALAKDFQNKDAQMSYLSIMLYAKKK